MTSRERVRAIIEHRPADQVGVNFNPPHASDFGHIGVRLVKPAGIRTRILSGEPIRS